MCHGDLWAMKEKSDLSENSLIKINKSTGDILNDTNAMQGATTGSS